MAASTASSFYHRTSPQKEIECCSTSWRNIEESETWFNSAAARWVKGERRRVGGRDKALGNKKKKRKRELCTRWVKCCFHVAASSFAVEWNSKPVRTIDTRLTDRQDAAVSTDDQREKKAHTTFVVIYSPPPRLLLAAPTIFLFSFVALPMRLNDRSMLHWRQEQQHPISLPPFLSSRSYTRSWRVPYKYVKNKRGWGEKN